MSHRKMFALGLVATGAAILLIIGPVLSQRAFAESSYTLIPVEHGMQLKTPDGHVVFEYVTTKPENIGLTSPSAAYFHPVNTPSGETVTNVAPDDHPHHRGIFLGFLESEFHTPSGVSQIRPDQPVRIFDIERGDFWSWGFYAPRDNRVIRNRDVKLTSADGKRAQLEIHNEWLIENRKLLDETDEVTVTERNGVYVIDLAYQLAPIVDYVLKHQAFGGFAVQGQKAGEHYYSTASGKVTLPSPYYSVPDLDWPAEPWYDYTIHLTRDGKVVGFAVLDHPLNPPTRWHNTVWLINPCITSFGEMTIHPHEPLVLRYRVVVHDGPPPTEILQRLSEEWRGMQSNPFVSH